MLADMRNLNEEGIKMFEQNIEAAVIKSTYLQKAQTRITEFYNQMNIVMEGMEEDDSDLLDSIEKLIDKQTDMDEDLKTEIRNTVESVAESEDQSLSNNKVVDHNEIQVTFEDETTTSQMKKLANAVVFLEASKGKEIQVVSLNIHILSYTLGQVH